MQAPDADSLPAGSFTLRAAAVMLSAMPDVHKRPIHELRWRNFRALLRGPGGMTATAAAAKLGKSQAQISHFGGKKPIKIIGDDIAGEIEAAWGLPSGWLDVNHSEQSALAELGKPQQQSQPLTPDPDTLRQAYLLAYQQAALERGEGHKYRLEDDPERTTNAYAFLVAGGGARLPSEVASFVAAAMRQGQYAAGEKSGQSKTGGRRARRAK